MVIFPLAPDITIAQMWSNGAQGGDKFTKEVQFKPVTLFLVKLNSLKDQPT